jgi:hypothetical protein
MMITYITAGLLLLFSYTDIGGAYYRHTQECSSFDVVDRQWRLVLLSGGTYFYSIESLNTRGKKREASSQFSGTWNAHNDTLQLYPEKDFRVMTFVAKGNKLVALNQKPDTSAGFAMQLDYLEKVSTPGR